MANSYGRDVKDIEDNENIKKYIKEGIENEKAMDFLVENSKEKKASAKKEEKTEKEEVKKTNKK